MGWILDGFPTWSQNADPDPEQGADPFAVADCGEECCSIVLYGLMGVYTTETQVRQEMPGHADHGETTPGDIASCLDRRGLYCIARRDVGQDLKRALKLSIAVGSPCIVLGHFLSPNVLHWVVVIGYGDDHVLYIDPWYGRLDARHWQPFLGLCQGDYVKVRARSQAT